MAKKDKIIKGWALVDKSGKIKIIKGNWYGITPKKGLLEKILEFVPVEIKIIK